MFSITEKRGFDDLSETVSIIHRVKDSYSVPMILVCNKADLELEREVQVEEALRYAESLKIPINY